MNSDLEYSIWIHNRPPLRSPRQLSFIKGGLYQPRPHSIFYQVYVWTWVSKFGCKLHSLKYRPKRKPTKRQQWLDKRRVK